MTVDECVRCGKKISANEIGLNKKFFGKGVTECLCIKCMGEFFSVGIPFLITNYFCGNKSVFAVLNEPYSTFSTISVVCLAKTAPLSGDFFSAKTLRAEKSVFSDDFL